MGTLRFPVTDSQGNTSHGLLELTIGDRGPQPDIWLTGTIPGQIIPQGVHARLRGAVTLAGELMVHGLLTAEPNAIVDGGGYQIMFMNGGQADLAGEDTLAWWYTNQTYRVLPDGTILYTHEVDTTGQTLVFRNLSRIMFHEGAGVSTLRNLRVEDSGIEDELGFYPIHFHELGDNSRGSLVENVVVLRGRNHAFVPHASHGITFRGCAAVDITGDAYWWDPPPSNQENHIHATHDTIYERCLAHNVTKQGRGRHRVTGFNLRHGDGNVIIDCLAYRVLGGIDASGKSWPEKGAGSWLARNNQARECHDGHFNWQNNNLMHLVEDTYLIDSGDVGIDHGAYRNGFDYRRAWIYGSPIAVRLHSNSKGGDNPQRFEDIHTDGILEVRQHNLPEQAPTTHLRCSYTRVVYNGEEGAHPSTQIFEDCDLTPADFDLAGIHPQSRIEILERGTRVHVWDGGWD